MSLVGTRGEVTMKSYSETIGIFHAESTILTLGSCCSSFLRAIMSLSPLPSLTMNDDN